MESWCQGGMSVPCIASSYCLSYGGAQCTYRGYYHGTGKGTDNCRSLGNEGLLCSSQQPITTNPHHPTNIPHASSRYLQYPPSRRWGPRSQLSIGRGVKSRCKISHKFWFHGQKSRGTCGIKLQRRSTNPQIGLLFVCPSRIWNPEKSLW